MVISLLYYIYTIIIRSFIPAGTIMALDWGCLGGWSLHSIVNIIREHTKHTRCIHICWRFKITWGQFQKKILAALSIQEIRE